MNGEETCVRKGATETPTLSINKVVELTNQEQMDLIILSANPQLNTLWKFMEMEIVNARDEAMDVDPSEPVKQQSKMTIAHAMGRFYTHIRQRIAYVTREHLNEAQRLDYERKMGSPEEIEKILIDNF